MTIELIGQTSLNEIAKIVSNEGGAKRPAYIALGSSALLATDTGNTLATEVIRKEAVITRTDNTVWYEIVVSPAEADFTLTEVGLFSDAATGVDDVRFYYRTVTAQIIDNTFGARITVGIPYAALITEVSTTPA